MTSKFHPTSRSYYFEAILYFLEKGPAGIVIIDVVLSYLQYNLGNYFSLWDSPLIPITLLLVFNPLVVVVLFMCYMIASSYLSVDANPSKCPNWNKPQDTQVKFLNTSLLKTYENRRIPIETAIELYFNSEIEFLDTHQVFYNRYRLFTFVITFGHIKWFLSQFLGQLYSHTKESDAEQVGDVYNRGNDFYNWFLGPSMVYTSAIFRTRNIDDETLEDAQIRKIRTTLESIHLKENEELLDIGCGWGTLVIYAAEHFNARATGCTIAAEQIKWCKAQAVKHNVTDRCEWILDDYRTIPQHSNNKKYDKITCLEMAEHVGIKNFQSFLLQIHRMLKDNGMFYIQMCGVRRTWSFEDLMWILFMGKYVFPGADASTPINWVLNQLERSGFELHRVENCGTHYGRTIQMWHRNWIKNRSAVVDKYGERWWRLWDVFLAWSTMIARQGTSAVYMMVCNKNLYLDQFSAADGPAFNRSLEFIGDHVISYQQ